MLSTPEAYLSPAPVGRPLTAGVSEQVLYIRPVKRDCIILFLPNPRSLTETTAGRDARREQARCLLSGLATLAARPQQPHPRCYHPPSHVHPCPIGILMTASLRRTLIRAALVATVLTCTSPLLAQTALAGPP